ncbi:HAD family hydrolase [Actinospica robiniae]|uniref:HAD family hydrolase n=1 Tax=Actinospica robiniae TaxID=304901 RepID=UPI0004294301|nr:HAD family hydrolase [Actinospica robiniae]
MSASVRAVIFDVGETLLDDSTFWGSWADWLGVPRHTLAVLVGVVTTQGRDNAEALRLIKPGFDLVAERAARERAGHGESITDADLYPDARPTLGALRDAGFWVGIAGNQTERAGLLLRALELPVDAIATSDEWNVAKPDSRFFERLCTWSGHRADQIVYVGDHRDNDIIAAHSAGLHTAHIRRGPWGYQNADDPKLRATATWRINELTELPALLISSDTG